MAIASMELDPNAVAYTDDEIVEKINTATVPIDRADAIDYDALDLVKTGPPVGGFKVKQVDRTSDGKLDVKYDDVAVT